MNKDNSQIKELRLLRSSEISPIKVTSHTSSNKKVSTATNCIVFEVCDDEINDKENKQDKQESISNSVGKRDSYKEKQRKVIVKSRFAETQSKNKEISKPKTKLDLNKKRKSQIIYGAKKIDKVSNISEDEMSKPKIKLDVNKKRKSQLIDGSKKIDKVSNISDDVQSDFDSLYCQYIQSFYLNSLTSSAVGKQKLEFTNQYAIYNERLLSLTKQSNELDNLINNLKLMKNFSKLICEKSKSIENLTKSINDCKLEEFSEKLKISSQIIEIDDNIDLGEILQDKVAAIDNFVRRVLSDEKSDVSITNIFESLNAMLSKVNRIIIEQSSQADMFKKKSIDYVYDLLKSVPN